MILALTYLFSLYVGPVLFLYAVAGLLDRAAGQ